MQEPIRPPTPPSSSRGFKFRSKRRRVRYVALLPTTLTLCNGICGMLAIMQTAMALATHSIDGIRTAGYLILAAMIFDALDGKVARITRTASSFGAMLDSLSDLVTFGVAPAFLVYASFAHHMSTPGATYWLPERVVLVVCVFYAMCALIRLARFTVETTPDEKSHLEFTGLPSPAAAGVVASSIIPWRALKEIDFPVMSMIFDALPKALPVLTFAAGVLMVSRIRYAHLVNRVFRGFRPFVALVELALVAIFLVVFYEFAIFTAFVVFAASGPVLWGFNRIFRRQTAEPPVAAEPTPAPEQDHLF